MAATKTISPGNDYEDFILLEETDATTGVVGPVTSGTITGFLSKSNSSTATAIDPTLSVSGVYVGGANGYDAGTWMFIIDATAITSDLIGTSGTIFFIVQKAGAVRVYRKLKVVDARPAEIETAAA